MVWLITSTGYATQTVLQLTLDRHYCLLSVSAAVLIGQHRIFSLVLEKLGLCIGVARGME